MTDSVQIIRDTIYNADLLDTVAKVDGFYMNSWNRYVTVASIVVGVAGVLMPLLFKFLQDRRYKIDKSELDTLKVKIQNSEKELEDLKNEYRKKMDEYSPSLDAMKQKYDDRMKSIENDVKSLFKNNL